MPLAKPKPTVSLKLGDWVVVHHTGGKGIVEKIMDDGWRLLIRIPSTTDWPFPAWAHVHLDEVRRCRPPKSPKQKLITEEALL